MQCNIIKNCTESCVLSLYEVYKLTLSTQLYKLEEKHNTCFNKTEQKTPFKINRIEKIKYEKFSLAELIIN